MSLPTDLLVQAACVWEVLARKVGNVHRHADFPDTDCSHFLLSAAAIAPHLCRTAPVGERIHHAVTATRAAVGQNTNLGIVLLLAPLTSAGAAASMREATALALDSLSIEDAGLAYDAIRLANPGGLGTSSEQDVRAAPTVTLLEAMKLAADRDFVARQYANGFADVFDFGIPALKAAFATFGCVEAAIIDCQLRWLAAYPDSLIARKNGPAVAENVRRRAADVLNDGGLATTKGRRAGTHLDRFLRSDGNKLNPGTTADLVAACLFVALREDKLRPSAPFPWPAPDWLAT